MLPGRYCGKRPSPPASSPAAAGEGSTATAKTTWKHLGLVPQAQTSAMLCSLVGFLRGGGRGGGFLWAHRAAEDLRGGWVGALTSPTRGSVAASGCGWGGGAGGVSWGRPPHC